MKLVLLLGCLVLWLSYGCEDKGLTPIDMPDPTDSIPLDTMPVDTMPIEDTTWKVLINEVKGNYLGNCYIHDVSSFMPETFDTLYNVTVTIDSIERIKFNGEYKYVLRDENSFFVFYIPEAEFAQDTVDMFALGGSQAYTKNIQLIRSQRFLYSKRGVYPGPGFRITECYCTKQ